MVNSKKIEAIYKRGIKALDIAYKKRSDKMRYYFGDEYIVPYKTCRRRIYS